MDLGWILNAMMDTLIRERQGEISDTETHREEGRDETFVRILFHHSPEMPLFVSIIWLQIYIQAILRE